MHRLLGTALCLGLTVLPVAAVPLALGAVAAADPPTRSVAVTGTGVTTWPAYDGAIGRFAIDTTSATGGTVSVVPDTTDTAGTALVDGIPVPLGEPVDVTGLQTGDEVSVIITDSAGTTRQSFVYLPAEFPALSTTSSGAGPVPGRVFLTLTSFGTPEKFEAIVDAHGVPIHVRQTTNPMDLKVQPNGSYSIARGETSALDSTFDIVELDDELQPVASFRTVGLQNTDFHDSVLLPDGGRILMAYEPNDETGLVDSVVQEVTPAGQVALTWNSRDHVDPETDGLTGLADYAHLNSIDVMADGNLLLSFRHTSQVMKIDRDTGEVMWRLGGVASDFTFPDDPWGGPCAQHTARELANGNIQIFDNGSNVTSMTLKPMCPDPVNPTGPPVSRPLSRVTEYHLDEGTHQAQLVWQHETGGFSEFAGSAQRLGAETDDDHTLVGTADGHLTGSGADAADVLELDPAGDVVWALSAPGFFSYRAFKGPAPDATEPVIHLADGIDGAVLQEGQELVADFRCTDRGGSNLATCGGGATPGQSLDVAPGAHEVELVATDGAGNTTARTISYTVEPEHQPDAMIRKSGDRWVGADEYGPARDQAITWRVGTADRTRAGQVRVQNDGFAAGRILLTGTDGGRNFRVTWWHDDVDVTARLAEGRLRTPILAAGDPAYRLRLVVKRLPAADPGDSLNIRLTAVSAVDGTRRDGVMARVIHSPLARNDVDPSESF